MLFPSSAGVRDPSLCWGAQLGWPLGGGLRLVGPTGLMLATSPWDGQGGRGEEAQSRAPD